MKLHTTGFVTDAAKGFIVVARCVQRSIKEQQ